MSLTNFKFLRHILLIALLNPDALNFQTSQNRFLFLVDNAKKIGDIYEHFWKKSRVFAKLSEIFTFLVKRI